MSVFEYTAEEQAEVTRLRERRRNALTNGELGVYQVVTLDEVRYHGLAYQRWLDAKSTDPILRKHLDEKHAREDAEAVAQPPSPAPGAHTTAPWARPPQPPPEPPRAPWRTDGVPPERPSTPAFPPAPPPAGAFAGAPMPSMLQSPPAARSPVKRKVKP